MTDIYSRKVIHDFINDTLSDALINRNVVSRLELMHKFEEYRVCQRLVDVPSLYGDAKTNLRNQSEFIKAIDRYCGGWGKFGVNSGGERVIYFDADPLNEFQWKRFLLWILYGGKY